MSDRASETITKVPILGDIPVIGSFFRSSSRDLKKTNIIIALTPYVISDLSDLRRVAEKKMRERASSSSANSSAGGPRDSGEGLDFGASAECWKKSTRPWPRWRMKSASCARIRERDGAEDSTPIEPPLTAGAPAPVLRRKRAARLRRSTT